MQLTRLRTIACDPRGGAAVEFALVAPVMVLLYCGLAELSLGMMAERRAAHATSIVADLVAQTSSMNSSQMTDIFSVADAILKPFPTAPLQIRVTSVKADSYGSPKVVWSQGHSYGALGAGGTVSGMPSSLLAANESTIMAEVSYTYASPLQYAVPGGMSFHQTFYLKPRKSPEVVWGP